MFSKFKKVLSQKHSTRKPNLEKLDIYSDLNNL